MPYRMRFFVADPQGITLPELEQGLKSLDASYRIAIDGNVGELYHGEQLYGQIEINRPGDGLFEAEIQETVEEVEDAAEGQKKRVVKLLRHATATVALQVLSQGRDSESTLSKIDPLWQWLFLFRRGVLQADGEGFYDEDGLIVEAT